MIVADMLLRICITEKKNQQIYQLMDEAEIKLTTWPVTDKHPGR